MRAFRRHQKSRCRAPDCDAANAISDKAMALGLRARSLGGTIAFSPPLCITAEEVDIVIETMGAAIAGVGN